MTTCHNVSCMPARIVSRPTTPAQKPAISWGKIIEAARQEATGAKTSSYLLTTLATGLIYTLVSLLIISLSPDSLLIPLWLVLSFLFAVSFSPIRYAMEELIRQVFPGTDYDSHALVKRLNMISYSSLTLNDLSRLFIQEFALSLDVPESAFVFFENSSYLVKTSDHFQNLLSLKKSELDLIIRYIGHTTSPLKNLKSDEANDILRSHHIRIIVPLTVNTQLTGLLILGSKYHQRPYTTKDIKVLDAIAPKIGFAVKNAHTFERVERKNEKLITELQDANEKLRLANRQLRRDDKLKDEFVYIATHELKNPVTAMRGYLSLIKENFYGKVPAKLKTAMIQIDTSNQQLINLLNNLLQIARAEAQRLDIHTAPVVICKVIDEVSRDIAPILEQKNLRLEHVCQNTSISVMADRERLREIINNLLSNAVKYSEKGTIQINHEIHQDQLITHIKDEGVGISTPDQKKIFTRFFRVQEEAAKGIPGTGLGLFICKQLIEKMGGRIWFTSTPHQGSTFSFSLPITHTYTLKSR